MTNKRIDRNSAGHKGMHTTGMRWPLLALTLIFVGSVTISTGFAGVGVSVKVGTQGLGGDLTVGLVDKLNIRAGVSGASFDDDYDDDDGNALSADVNLQVIPILLDWHPSGGAFRISGGVMINNNEISMTAVPGDTVELNDVDYQVDRLDAEITFDSLAPYVGIGVGNAANSRSRVNFVFDLGVMYHGSPEFAMSATASNSALQSDLDQAVAVEVDEFNEDIENYSWYPVLNFGILVRF
ncbi:MAG: hypothetical protein HN341_02215 [Verrucomicrobia bacterium]|jgi:hypothetical protein|nr:hypothetical protein [Verrucomicrobiota bacterium]